MKDGPPPPPMRPSRVATFRRSVLKAIWGFGRTVGVRHKTTERPAVLGILSETFHHRTPQGVQLLTLSRSLTPLCLPVSLIVRYT